MGDADRIRIYAREKYVLPARNRKEQRFSIKTGDVVREMRLSGRTNAVCSALKTREFRQQNSLTLVEITGPPSGQSTTVTYTYEFVHLDDKNSTPADPWTELRGIAKDIFASLGGGEAFIRQERANFYGPEKDKALNKD